MTKLKYLFYISQNYSYEILRPLENVIKKMGGEVAWFGEGKALNRSYFSENELVLKNILEVIHYNPSACFVPGNLIPSFIPGLKVQVFHGLEWKKKGHFVIRDCFDLYCTHGSATTSRFNELADIHQNFDVVETGWSKLDKLFTAQGKAFFNDKKPTILYAPTFSPSLTSAPSLLAQIKNEVAKNTANWLVKFHPKMNQAWIQDYQQIKHDNFKIIETSNLNEILHSADIMISDTSSVIGEFSLLGKPTITLNNSDPGDYLINITKAEALPNAITAAFTPSDTLLAAIKEYAQALHPYKDGMSSLRIIQAVEEILLKGKKAPKPLPRNFFRNLKQRIKLKYWQ